MTDGRFTDDELWILRAAIECLSDYHRENGFPTEVRERTNSLWLKVLKMIDYKPLKR